MIDGNESHLTQAFTLHAVVYDVPQAIEFGALGQFFLSLLYRRGHAKAETTTVVNLYIKHLSTVQNRHPAAPELP